MTAKGVKFVLKSEDFGMDVLQKSTTRPTETPNILRITEQRLRHWSKRFTVKQLDANEERAIKYARTSSPRPFPIQPTPSARNAKGWVRRLRLPDARHQAQRLAPQFQQLQQAMERRRVSLQDNPMGIQPEQVLVLETIGSIEKLCQRNSKSRRT